MNGLAGCVGCVLALAMPAVAGAQQTLVAVEKPMTVTDGSSLPSNTEVWLSMNQELSSKGIKQGQKFDLTVARDVMVGNYVVIPRGARGHGQISYRTGKGAFGKSAKMEFDLVDVDVGGTFVPLSGHYRIEGQGNTGAAVGAVVVAGVFGAFVTGRSAVAAQGTEWKAFTREPLALQVASARPAPLAAPVVTAAPVAQPAPVPLPVATAPQPVAATPAPIAVNRRALTPYQLGRLQGEQAVASVSDGTGAR